FHGLFASFGLFAKGYLLMVSNAVRIAVLADTHDRCPEILPGLMRGADEIWHLGDVCHPDILDDFVALGVPLVVVEGSCDPEGYWPLTRSLARGGHWFPMEHIPPRGAQSGVHFVLHGHTHVPRDETDPLGVRWLNPGCITAPRAGVRSFA